MWTFSSAKQLIRSPAKGEILKVRRKPYDLVAPYVICGLLRNETRDKYAARGWQEGQEDRQAGIEDAAGDQEDRKPGEQDYAEEAGRSKSIENRDVAEDWAPT